MASSRANFRKHERLTGRDAISAVVKSGTAMNEAPIRLVGLITPLDSTASAQVAFAVPKRYVRLAADRNRIRRRMREAYRLEKERWYDQLRAADKQVAWLLVYQSSQILGYTDVRGRISRVLDRWLEKHLPA